MSSFASGRVSRRGFLAAGSAGLLAARFASGPSRSAAAEEADAAQLVTGKDRRLIVHEASPVSLETPVELLSSGETPLDVLFVRNNQHLPNSSTLAPIPLAGWKIEITGLIGKPVVFDAGELIRMDQVEQTMVLQCSGNGRSIFSETTPTKGSPWTRGGMGNVRFKGVPLVKLIETLKVQIDPKAKFLTPEGRDDALSGHDDFEHSLPLDDVLSRSFLALQLNGKPLPAVHGGPVRLVTPGYYGTMQIKWLSKLRFEAAETTNEHQLRRYRVPKNPIPPGSSFHTTFENSTANWRMKLKTVVLTPAPDAKVMAGKSFEVRGVAFNDGTVPIESVLMSVDRGQSWQRTELVSPKDLSAWYGWSTSVTLAAGRHEIWVRGIDALGRSQPLDGGVHWNPSGYEWNGTEKIPLTVQ